MDPIEIQKRFQQMTAGGASGQAMADYAEDLVAEAEEGARRTGRVATGIGAGLLGVLASALALGAAGLALGPTDGPGDVPTGLALAVATALCVGFAFVLGRTFLALRPRPRELVTTGVRARLTVRDYRRAPGSFGLRTGSAGVDLQRVAIDLDVVTAPGEAYRATVREYLTGRAFVKLAPGATLVGYVDRADPRRIFIDWRARAVGA